jgi:hypothetical protein
MQVLNLDRDSADENHLRDIPDPSITDQPARAFDDHASAGQCQSSSSCVNLLGCDRLVPS